jgi:hypothetical protein
MELLAFFLLYFGLTFVWRSVVVFRKTGINPLVLGKGDDAYGYVGRAFKLTIMLIAAFVLMRAFWPASIQELGTLGALQTPTWTALGWVLMGLSLVIMLVAQAQMGLSWRIGIDEKNRTGLVTQGLFGLSRTPICRGFSGLVPRIGRPIRCDFFLRFRSKKTPPPGDLRRCISV